MTHPAENSRASFFGRGLLFALLVLSGLALFLIPAWIIQPFKHQSPRALELALEVHAIAPWGTLIAVALAFVLAFTLWKQVAIWKRALLVIGLALATAATVMARIDYFEWMFHPLGAPGFQTVAATRLDPGEMVLAVRFGNDARAYPIRAMAYHHVVNDVVDGIPVTVTY